MNHHMSHEEMVQYLENLKLMIEDCHRKDRAACDKNFFELRLYLHLLFDLLRRDADRLEARIVKLDDAQTEARNPIEVSLPYWALN
jgi:hypothetical protein